MNYALPSNPGSIGGTAEPSRFSDVTNTTVEGVRPTRNAVPAASWATSLVIVISDGISLPQKSHAQNNNKGYGFLSVIVYSPLCLFMRFGSHPGKYPWTLCQLTDSSRVRFTDW